MPGKNGGNSGQSFAHKLIVKIVRHFNFLIDLHTASFGRVNSLYVRADMNDQDVFRIAMLQVFPYPYLIFLTFFFFFLNNYFCMSTYSKEIG